MKFYTLLALFGVISGSKDKVREFDNTIRLKYNTEFFSHSIEAGSDAFFDLFSNFFVNSQDFYRCHWSVQASHYSKLDQKNNYQRRLTTHIKDKVIYLQSDGPFTLNGKCLKGRKDSEVSIDVKNFSTQIKYSEEEKRFIIADWKFQYDFDSMKGFIIDEQSQMDHERQLLLPDTSKFLKNAFEAAINRKKTYQDMKFEEMEAYKSQFFTLIGFIKAIDLHGYDATIGNDFIDVTSDYAGKRMEALYTKPAPI